MPASAFRASGNTWSARLTIDKNRLDPDRQLFFGWASVIIDEQGRVIVDHDRDVIPVDELEKAAYGHVLEHRKGTEMHAGAPVSTLVESVVLTAEKRSAMALGAGPVGWWVGYKLADPAVWADVKTGKYSELSIGGTARRTPHPDIPAAFMLTELEVEEVALVDKGAGVGVRVTLLKRAKEIRMPKLSKSIVHVLKAMKPEDRARIEKTLEGAKIAKGEVLTLADVQAQLPEELWAVVLQAIDSAATSTAAPAPEPAPAEKPAEKPEDKTGHPEEEDEDKPTVKSLTKRLEAARAAQDREAKERIALEKRLAVVEKERRLEKARARIDKTLKAIPGDREELAKALLTVEEIAEADVGSGRDLGVLVKRLELASAALLESAMFKSLGSARPADDAPLDDLSPEHQLKRLAKTRAEKDKIPYAKAFRLVCHENPAIYAAHQAQGS